MKAIVYRRFGPPDVLEEAEIPEPGITSKQLLVKVHASSVNPVDWKIRSGINKIPGLRLPRVPGSDIAGEVVKVGGSVVRFTVGDPVYGALSPFSGGACAEYAALPEKNAALKPQNLSVEEAAAVPIAGLTALQALRDYGKIKVGQSVLINGASGGVGSFAVQIAKAYGAEVTAVAGGKNIDFVKRLGADHVLDYTAEDVTRTTKRYAVVFDAVASLSFKTCKPILIPGGSYITTLPSLSLIPYLFLTAVFGGKRAYLLTVRLRGADLEILREWIEAGKIRPVVEETFPLARTAEAHARSEAGHVRGKLVIQIGG